MLQEIYYSRKTDQAVQLISQCRILPERTEAVCFQQLFGEFQVLVMEKEQFEADYVKSERADDTVHGVSKSSREEDSGEISGLIRFLDAETYGQKMKILEEMKDDLNDHLLNNMAVSLDLSIEDGVDGYSFIMSELKIRSRYEGKRGDRL